MASGPRIGTDSGPREGSTISRAAASYGGRNGAGGHSQPITPSYAGRTRPVALAILLIAGATISGALISQHVFGLAPCKLCLQQRWPYYLGVPLAALTAALPPKPLRRIGFALLTLLFLVSTGLGAYHAGVEWGFWPGPNDCGGGMGAPPSDVGEFLKDLEGTTVQSCTEAAFRFLGLSLAGWNAAISLALSCLAGWSAARH